MGFRSLQKSEEVGVDLAGQRHTVPGRAMTFTYSPLAVHYVFFFRSSPGRQELELEQQEKKYPDLYKNWGSLTLRP